MTGPPRNRSRWRADLGPLRRSHQFRLLFIGQGVSFAGSMLTAVAVPFQAYAVSHSSLVVGLLSLAEVIPYLVLGFVGGAVADAVDRRRVVLVSDVGLAGCSAALVANAVIGPSRLWVLFVVAVSAATLGAFQRPSLDALLPRVVDPKDVGAATALSSLRSNLGQVVAPALAGGLIAVAGLGVTYGIDAATFLVSLGALWRMGAVPPPDHAEPLSLARIADGLRYVWSRPDLLGTYFVDMAAMFFGMPEALFPQLATHFGGAGVLGLLYSAPGAGSLVVSATSGWVGSTRRQGRAIVAAAAAWGCAVVAVGLARSLWLVLVALVIAGGLDMVSGLMRSTIWNQSIPDSLRGRLAGIELVSFTSGPALGNVAAGVVEALAGLPFSIVFGGVACVLSTLAIGAALPGLWRYDARRWRPAPDPPSGRPPG